MALTNVSLSIGISGKFTKTISSSESATDNLATPSNPWTVADGTGANQADLVWSDTITIAGSGNEVIDLSNLTDAFGGAVAFARIKGMIIVNKSTANSITVGNSTNAWEGWISATGTIIIPASTSSYNSQFSIFTPDATAWPVTAATDDELKILNNGGTSTVVEVILIGASA